jgi:hypothetical protein
VAKRDRLAFRFKTRGHPLDHRCLAGTVTTEERDKGHMWVKAENLKN